jgi:hypothetical protein
MSGRRANPPLGTFLFLEDRSRRIRSIGHFPRRPFIGTYAAPKATILRGSLFLSQTAPLDVCTDRIHYRRSEGHRKDKYSETFAAAAFVWGTKQLGNRVG